MDSGSGFKSGWIWIPPAPTEQDAVKSERWDLGPYLDMPHGTGSG